MKRILALFIFLIFCPLSAQATSSGPNSPGTTSDDSTVGTVTWNNPNNSKVNDTTYASALLNTGGATTHYLNVTNFGFSIPGGATINGIVVEVKKYTSSSDPIVDSVVKLVKGGVVSGNDKSSGSNWPNPTDPGTYVTYGGSSDLWGLTLSASDVNSSTFGFVISATQSSGISLAFSDNTFVDHIRMTVYYTAASGAQDKFFTLF